MYGVTTTVALALAMRVGDRRAGDVVVVGGAREAPGSLAYVPALVCVVLLTSTVPTVAPVSPFTPVIDVTVAVCGLPS